VLYSPCGPDAWHARREGHDDERGPPVGLHVDATSAVPPFEQLRTQIASLAASGQLAAGAKLPTVRGLAGELGVAAGTVARAYRELEADGVVVTEGRRGTFVSSSDAVTAGALESQAAGYVAAARRAGLTVAEATRLVERLWTP
jgi:DNA-binding transcriptional regulator YhcF (GntR family)